MKFCFLMPALLSLMLAAILNAEPAPPVKSAAQILHTYTLPRLSLSEFGNSACTPASLREAQRNGLKFTDLPSIGSGFAKMGNGEFVGITDRGPNGIATNAAGEIRRTFPLAIFCPTMVRFKLVKDAIQILEFIPLHDHSGHLLSGLSNLSEEERLYETADAKSPLPLDENGVDPEAIRVLPDGNFLLSEEYSPSILVVSPQGEVLVRYTPISKPLTNAAYPVKAILPAIFAQRRINHGFENLALSADGKAAYAILQGPMGDELEPRLAKSRILRAVKLDVSQPLKAKVAGEFLLQASAARDYSAGQKQDKISWSEADWIAPDQLLVVERVKGEARLLALDLRDATNILGHPEENTLTFETAKNLAAIQVQAAESHSIFSSRELDAALSDKLEGLVILSPTEVALSNDNDFGLGDNLDGEPSRVWIVRLPGLSIPPKR